MRNDISEYLIHFTKDSEENSALFNLTSILHQQTIFGGSGHIRGRHKCVCFSEAPLDAVRNGLVNQSYYSNYSGFGIMLKKEWLFRLGGRPVIYGPDDELNDLPSDVQWRTVKFNLLSTPRIDFTWEREWRIKTEELHFNPRNVEVIVPNRKYADQIFDLYIEPQIDAYEWWELEKENYIHSYSQIMERGHAEQLYGLPPEVGYFPWSIITLDRSLE